jgi:hypothetical protein
MMMTSNAWLLNIVPALLAAMVACCYAQRVAGQQQIAEQNG